MTAPTFAASRITILLAKTTCLALMALAAVVQSGCLGLASNLLHAVGANMVPAEYKGLEDKTVAVITMGDGSQYSDDVATRELSLKVAEILTKEIDDIRLVREDKIAKYRDINGWDTVDFGEIGLAVGADKVVGIELNNLRLQDGATLYRGRADVVVHVIDAATGTVEYTRNLDEFTYPTVAGQYTSETTEARFRKLYLGMLAQEIGRTFHPYDFTDRLALDSAIAR